MNGKRDKNTALNKKTVISRYKRNGCFSLFWEYFIFFHLFRNEQAVGSSPTISSKTCVNTAFSQVFSFSQMNFKIQYATKNLTLFYGVRFCSFIRFSVQDHLLTIYEFVTFPPSKFPIVFATFSCMESVTCI